MTPFRLPLKGGCDKDTAPADNAFVRAGGMHTMRWMGLDIGEKRIGVAVSDEDARFAFPLCVLNRSLLDDDVLHVVQLAAKQQAGGIVVGEPLDLSGRAGPAVRRVRTFADALRRHWSGPLEFVDERFSTAEAQRVLLAADASRARRRQVVDKMAAALILQHFLEREAS